MRSPSKTSSTNLANLSMFCWKNCCSFSPLGTEITVNVVFDMGQISKNGVMKALIERPFIAIAHQKQISFFCCYNATIA
jgi:hypothetical protein